MLMVCSAVEMVLPAGTFMTMMPRLVAASASTLSSPTPARPITLSRSALAMTSAVTFVALRTTRPSYWPMTCARSWGERPVLTSTDNPGSALSSAIPSSESGSAIRTFNGACAITAPRQARPRPG